jgi:beta-glucosidase
MKNVYMAIGFAAVCLVSCISLAGQSDSAPIKYLNPDLSPEERAADLVARMTLPEKISQMQNGAPAIPRLKIAAYDWWNEALHGDARAGLATVFPQAIGLAATFDVDLEHRIASAISTEARAKYNDAQRHDNHQRYYGLTFWSPNINIFRDPRWGRGQETYGEDPYLTSEMGLAFIKGMQGDDPHYFKTIATSKHFAVHSGPEVSRHQFDARVDEQDLDNTYLYAFRKTLSPGGADSVMCAYNSLDGSPACASELLLQDELRKKFKFKGYVVSDCGAITDVFEGHRFAASMAEAAAKSVKAGTDLTCGHEYSTLAEAVQKGFITEARIDESVKRLFVARIRLGMFDPPARVPFSNIAMAEVASPAHQQLALEAAEKSIVLLKNAGGILPFSNAPQRMAVVGPGSDDPDVMLGNYYGTPNHIVSPLAGIGQTFSGKSKIKWALGSVYATNSTALVPAVNLIAPAGQRGVLAQYFNNTNFAGIPALTRVEERGYFVYEMRNAAVMRAVPQPTFSVRWDTNLRPMLSGDYELGLARQECDSCIGSDTFKLTVDGKEAINKTERAAGGYQTFRMKVHLEAGQKYALRVEYSQQQGGSGVELVWTPPAEALLQEAVEAVKSSDVAIVCMGLNSRLEGEESPIEIPGFAHGDRTNIDVPEPQAKLLKAVLDTGKPTVVVLVNGSALAVNLAAERAQAIVESWYGGQDGGAAIARTLAGENNPAGRLPVTFYASTEQLPDFSDYSMKGRTYRYFTGKPLYPFGYGLSYSEFKYSDLEVGRSGGGVTVSAKVTNTSKRAGEEVVQVYADDAAVPNAELKAFQRVRIGPGETKLVQFNIKQEELHGNSISVGGGQPNSGSLKASLPK